MRGQVKWFNEAKGYGFVTCSETTSDYFFHHSNIMRGEVAAMLPGVPVRFDLGTGPKGIQAFRVRTAGNGKDE